MINVYCTDYVQIMSGVCCECGYETNFIQVDNAISTDSTQRQWVSLGNLSLACFTIPGTCGSVGGTLSVLIKIGAVDYPTGGIISSFHYSEGFQVFIYPSKLR